MLALSFSSFDYYLLSCNFGNHPYLSLSHSRVVRCVLLFFILGVFFKRFLLLFNDIFILSCLFDFYGACCLFYFIIFIFVKFYAL